jgi:hypothetical protein
VKHVAFTAGSNKVLDKLKRYGVKGQRIQSFLLAVQNQEGSLLKVYVFNAEAAYFPCSQADFHWKPDKQVVAEATVLPGVVVNF